MNTRGAVHALVAGGDLFDKTAIAGQDAMNALSPCECNPTVQLTFTSMETTHAAYAEMRSEWEGLRSQV